MHRRNSKEAELSSIDVRARTSWSSTKTTIVTSKPPSALVYVAALPCLILTRFWFGCYIHDFETADERQQTMAERSKELLQFEHKGLPFSSLESAVLVCDSKRESNTQTKRLPPRGMPVIAPPPPSQLLGKVKDFLGVMSEANKRLELDAKDHPKNYDIEELTGNESEVIEMNLMLGVADLHTPEAVAAAESAIATCQPVMPLAADGSETYSEDSSTEDDSGDDDIESSDNENSREKPSHAQISISSKDNIHEKQKNGNSKKRPRIVELS
ncbi:hypothetical protein VNO78_19267 [Psophocarpus tetragonolobus]|uniref:Uncharacterized protein n=1 Tax=Psophocarpus tetragonolobus TaxID=3891 RepID=A0AAN9XG77_PSOTE